MSLLLLAHLILVCIWFGVILTEVVIELGAKQDGDRVYVAKLHYRIDLMVELPILLAVLATGIVLTLQAWPLKAILWAKIILALAAVMTNLVCIVLVIVRRRQVTNPEVLQKLSVWILRTGAGIPLGLIAFYLGLRVSGMV